MIRAIRPTTIMLLAAGAILAVMFLTGVLGGNGPSPAGAATSSHASQSKTQAKARAAQTENESAAEAPGSEQENAAEAPGTEQESASEPAGEAQPGHEDAQGENVDHQCPGACAPGEQP